MSPWDVSIVRILVFATTLTVAGRGASHADAATPSPRPAATPTATGRRGVETPGSPAGAVVLETVEVTAEPISEAEQRAPTAFVTEVAIDERDAAVETMADVLQESVGVQVQRFGGLGTFSTISIRGSSANQVPVFLDGVPLSQAQDQTVNLADLPLDSLETIEVYRGTVPVGFGGGGIGGVVNLVTARPSATPQTTLAASYGSFVTRKVVAADSRRVGETDLVTHVNYLGSKGDFTYADDNGTPENPTDDECVTRINNAFNAVGALAKAGRDLGDGLRLDVTAEGFYKHQGVPGPGSTQFADPSLTDARGLAHVRLRHQALAPGVVAAANLFGVYSLQAFDDPQGDFGVKQNTRNQTALVGSTTSGTWFAPFQQAVGWFGELSYDQFFPYNEYAAPYPPDGPDQTRLRLTLAAQDHASFFRDRVAVVPSLRYDYLRDDFSGVNVTNAPVTPPQTVNRDLWSPAIGGQLRPFPWLLVQANIGQFQRPPNFSELFGNSGTVLGNANLVPETAINRDIGFVVTVPPFRWLDGAGIEYAYFHNNVTDLIAFEAVSRSQFRPFNIGDARLLGHELSVDATAFGHAGVTLNYTHQDTEDRSGIPSRDGNQLPLRPADELFLHLEGFGRWGKLYYEYTYISSDPTDPANFIVVPSRSIHNVGAVATPLEWLTVKFEAVNILNADVRDLGDFPLPGLTFFGGIEVDL